MYRLLYGLPVLALAVLGLVSNVTFNQATTIAGIVMLVAPFVLKYVPLKGTAMAALSMVLAAAVAVGAGFYTGEVTTSSFDLQNLAVTAGALWAVSQAVYQLFKQNKTFGFASKLVS